MTNLRLKISVDDSPGVHEADGRNKLAHDPAGLSLGELVLLADALEQLAAFEQLEHQIGVRLVVKHLLEPHHVGVALARAQQVHLLRAVDAAADDFDGILDARLPVPAPSTHREAAIAEDRTVQVKVVLEEERRVHQLVAGVKTSGVRLVQQLVRDDVLTEQDGRRHVRVTLKFKIKAFR